MDLSAVASVVAGAAAGAAFLALVLERLIEYLVAPVLPTDWHDLIPYVSAALGVAGAFAFQVDVISPTMEAFGADPLTAWAGYLTTGLLIGGGSNLIHDLWPGSEARAAQ